MITPDTDTYGTVDEADTYFADLYGYDKWDALTTLVKEQSLRSATQRLDVLCEWDSYEVDSNQVLAFPRYGADPTPDAVKYAQFEIAYAIVDTGSVSTTGDDPLTELKAGSVTMKFKPSAADNPIVNDLVIKLLAPYGSCKGRYSIPLVRN